MARTWSKNWMLGLCALVPLLIGGESVLATPPETRAEIEASDSGSVVRVTQGTTSMRVATLATLTGADWVYPCQGRVLVHARDAYGELLLGLSQDAGNSLFELRGRLIVRAGDQVFVAPFWPVHQSGPDQATVHQVPLAELCALDEETADRLTPNAFEGWGIGASVYRRDAARVALFPRPLSLQGSATVFLVHTAANAAYVLSCGSNGCTEQPLFADERQSSIEVASGMQAPTPGAVLYKVASWAVDADAVLVEMRTAQSKSARKRHTLSVRVPLVW